MAELTTSPTKSSGPREGGDVAMDVTVRGLTRLQREANAGSCFE